MIAELDLDERALCDTFDTAMALPSAGWLQLRQTASERLAEIERSIEEKEEVVLPFVGDDHVAK